MAKKKFNLVNQFMVMVDIELENMGKTRKWLADQFQQFEDELFMNPDRISLEKIIKIAEVMGLEVCFSVSKPDEVLDYFKAKLLSAVMETKDGKNI